MKINSPFLNQVENHLKEFISDSSINAHLLAESFNYSRSQFAKKIQRLTGLSINEFIYQKRLEHAEELLLGTDKFISDIAFESGFNDPSHFSKRFKKSRGLSPRAYREQHWIQSQK